MKIKAQLLELAALRGELRKIALAFADVIWIAVLGVAVQELGTTRRAIGWFSLAAVSGSAFVAAALLVLSLL